MNVRWISEIEGEGLAESERNVVSWRKEGLFGAIRE